MDHADFPGRALVDRDIQAVKRAPGRTLGVEDSPVDDRVDRREDHTRLVGREHRDPVATRPGHRGQIVRAIYRCAVIDVVGAGDDDGADRGSGDATELGGHAFHRSARLRVRVEEVAGDEEQIDRLGNGEVDRGSESCELAFAKNRCSLSEIGVPSPEVDIGGVKQTKHRASGSSCGHSSPAGRGGDCRRFGDGRSVMPVDGRPAPSETERPALRPVSHQAG